MNCLTEHECQWGGGVYETRYLGGFLFVRRDATSGRTLGFAGPHDLKNASAKRITLNVRSAEV
jgi:hypothetical protein